VTLRPRLPWLLPSHNKLKLLSLEFGWGAVLRILVGGCRPSQGEGKECKEKVRHEERKFHQKRWSAASDKAKLLIPRTVAVDPSQRDAANKEALNGAWMTMAEERTQPKKLAFKLEIAFTS
jgi:hypothetical protein